MMRVAQAGGTGAGDAGPAAGRAAPWTDVSGAQRFQARCNTPCVGRQDWRKGRCEAQTSGMLRWRTQRRAVPPTCGVPASQFAEDHIPLDTDDFNTCTILHPVGLRL